MAFVLPDLPFPIDSLEPHISKETLEYHHGKHHATYVTKLNGLVQNTEYATQSLEELIKTSTGAVFNNAAQIWNHTFYWNCLSPEGGGEPTGDLATSIANTFGSFAKFKESFNTHAANNFGSGWTWLVKRSDCSLAILDTGNAATPLTDSSCKPLLTVDVWEHAYYIDYRNSRPNYLEAFWKLVNWTFVQENFKS